jgi:hypothetical protein
LRKPKPEVVADVPPGVGVPLVAMNGEDDGNGKNDF